jgi:uncharacterized protein (DUF2252 family)
MNINKSTADYERWVARHIQVVKPDVELKHREMAESLFMFFRATFYRWSLLWPRQCESEAAAPKILAVGDLHVENFGTWRDIEGRLIWGVNDFDEAFEMPYTIDLVRLAASAHIAAEEATLAARPRHMCQAIAEGYQEGVEAGGRAFVLAENNRWLRRIALGRLRDPVRFWRRMTSLPEFPGNVPAEMRREMESHLPARGLAYRCLRRVAGLGSLGHMRVVAVAQWQGGWVAREAKALAPSAWAWAAGIKPPKDLHYTEIVRAAVRVPDPFLHLRGHMMVRRLAPDCSRVQLGSLPTGSQEVRLLRAMGFETANIHCGNRARIAPILRDLKKRPDGWLHRAAKQMVKATRKDWQKWRAGEK